MTDKDYNHCVDAYSNGVYRFIIKNIRQQADAEDIVQSAFEKLWVHREKVTVEKAKSYLFTIAYHEMIDHIRKIQKMNLVVTEEVPHPSTFQTDTALKQILMHAIHSLNPTQKSLVLLKDYEGYSYHEIGEIMNLSASQVKVYLHRARIILKNKLTSLVKISNECN